MQASFDLSEYKADEIRVQTDGRRLIVRAQHEHTGTDSKNTLSRQFTRQVQNRTLLCYGRSPVLTKRQRRPLCFAYEFPNSFLGDASDIIIIVCLCILNSL